MSAAIEWRIYMREGEDLFEHQGRYCHSEPKRVKPWKKCCIATQPWFLHLYMYYVNRESYTSEIAWEVFALSPDKKLHICRLYLNKPCHILIDSKASEISSDISRENIAIYLLKNAQNLNIITTWVQRRKHKLRVETHLSLSFAFGSDAYALAAMMNKSIT